MIRTILSAAVLLLHAALNAQFNWQWAEQLTAQIPPSMHGLAVDADGNTVVCGAFYGTLTVGTLPPLVSSGESDLFVAKFAPDGTPLWMRSAGGDDFDEALDVTVDTEGRIAITGYFESASITLGATALDRLGNMDALVAQYDAGGAVLWAQRYGWTANSGLEWGLAILADANNDLYVAGQYKNALQVPGLPDLDACNNREQGFLMKLDAQGNGLWSLRPQCTSDQSLGQTTCNALALDPEGNLYLGGHFRGDTAFFATDTLPNYMPSGQSDDVFVVKYTPAGEERWVKAWAGFNYDAVKSIATDSEGNVVVATTREGGYLIDGIDVPFAGTQGVYRISLWKVDPQGTALWGLRMGNSTYEHEIMDLAVDANDHIWAGGYFGSTCTFGDVVLPNDPDRFYGLFTVHLAPNGEQLDLYVDRGARPRRVNKVACDASGGLYLAGATLDTITFAPLAPLNGEGGFVLKSDDLSTGLVEAPADRSWYLAPVPADVRFSVYHREEAPRGPLRVTDALGREVFRTTATASTLAIDCSTWPAGSYSVHVGGACQRLLVLH